MLFKLTAIISISSFTAAALSFGIKEERSGGPLGKFAGCPVAEATLTFPEGQTALSIPPGQVPNHVLLGMGIQNYTCGASGTYVYVPGLDSPRQVANAIIDFVELPVPSPSCTTFLA